METKDSILYISKELFWTYGIRSVTVDDIALKAGVSKKTIYQLFKDKAEIIRSCTQLELNDSIEQLNKFQKESKDAVQETINIVEYAKKVVFSMHPSLLFDMQRYYPSSWKIYSEYKKNHHYSNLVKNICRGQSEKLYRPEIDAPIIAKLRLEQIQLAYDPTIFSPQEFEINKVQMQLLEHFIHGLVTPLGLERFLSYRSQLENS